jgi:hypothetical protein
VNADGNVGSKFVIEPPWTCAWDLPERESSDGLSEAFERALLGDSPELSFGFDGIFGLSDTTAS